MIKCDRCNRKVLDAWYILSHKMKGLYVNCRRCGTHMAPFQENLNIRSKPSKSYIQEVLKSRPANPLQ